MIDETSIDDLLLAWLYLIGSYLSLCCLVDGISLIWLIDRIINWLIGWLVFWLADRSIDSLTDWLVDELDDKSINLFA